MALQITDVKKVSKKSILHSVEKCYSGFVVTSGASGQKYFVRLSPVSPVSGQSITRRECQLLAVMSCQRRRM